jgi:hypothetical protein
MDPAHSADVDNDGQPDQSYYDPNIDESLSGGGDGDGQHHHMDPAHSADVDNDGQPDQSYYDPNADQSHSDFAGTAHGDGQAP